LLQLRVGAVGERGNRGPAGSGLPRRPLAGARDQLQHELRNDSGSLDSVAEVQAALDDPGADGATDLGVVQLFECPVIAAG